MFSSGFKITLLSLASNDRSCFDSAYHAYISYFQLGHIIYTDSLHLAEMVQD